MPDRRTFLRGLASLPLIGGSVALIGNPTAAAVPATPELLADYADFLGLERWRTLEMLYDREMAQRILYSFSVHGPAWDWHKTSGEPSTRAAVVLATVGMPLTWKSRCDG